ncbi:hypothetical protein [Lentibacillus salinarum]|uniref:MarR family transcriptional regulator n=1 Tax=Lentibacillus salinarum TaxID=446820 RepID=A0ABW3ZW99_9BACI
MAKLHVMKDNLKRLMEEEYLSNDEYQFMSSLFFLIHDHSNAIAKNIIDFMTLSEIAESLKQDKKETGRMIECLDKKGILFEFLHGPQIKEFDPEISKRPLFFNPEIVYKGDIHEIDATLSALTSHFDKLDQRIKLPYKIWYPANAEYGMVIPREWIMDANKAEIYQ